MKRICLITSGHLSSNPRLVKEAIALDNCGYKIHIVFIQNLSFLVKHDQKILNNHPDWEYTVLNNENINGWKGLKKVCRTLISKLFIPFFKIRKSLALAKIIINKNYYWQVSRLKSIESDLYIAHNLGALPVAVNAAKANKTKCGFDAEDFHRNEISDEVNSFDVRLKKYIEDEYLKEIDYFTAASPLIANAYKGLYPKLDPIIINNVFEIRNQPEININKNNVLKLFWFSQTVGRNRGLEDIIRALNVINNSLIELHFLGALSSELQHYFNNLATFEIQYYTPIEADEIFDFASKFDIGLALEPGFCFNNKIALSNKIFTYLISGLAILASNTAAQQDFLQENKNIGELYQTGNTKALTDIITKLFNNREQLNEYKRNSFNLAQSKYNWELEQNKFLKIVNEVVA